MDLAQHFRCRTKPIANSDAYRFRESSCCMQSIKNKERIKFAAMKLYEAERMIKEALNGIYDEQEAMKIADLALEHISTYQRKERLFKKEEELSSQQQIHLNQVMQRLQQH